MIVRINHFAAAHAERLAGWPGGGLHGPIRFEWPGDTHAYELFVREQDETLQSLSKEYRQRQLRLLVPEVLTALREAGEQVVVRLDGPVAEREMAALCEYLPKSRKLQRYVMSGAAKLDPAAAAPVVSVRLQAGMAEVADLCAEPALGLERSVRLRAFCVPPEYVVPLMEITRPDDDGAWREVMPRVSFVLGSVQGLQSLHVITRRYGPEQVKGRLMGRLAGGTA